MDWNDTHNQNIIKAEFKEKPKEVKAAFLSFAHCMLQIANSISKEITDF